MNVGSWERRKAPGMATSGSCRPKAVVPLPPKPGRSLRQAETPIADVPNPIIIGHMPPARTQSTPVDPAPLTNEEATFIRDTMSRFFGPEIVLRNFGSDPTRIAIHVETDREVGMEKYDCMGVLMTRIDRPISVDVTRRGTRVYGNAKLAYRQGVIF